MEIALHHKGADNSAGILLSGASLGAQLVKNLPVMQETPVRFLDWEESNLFFLNHEFEILKNILYNSEVKIGSSCSQNMLTFH